MGLPFVPTSITNPVGSSRRISAVVKKIDESLDGIESWLIPLFEQIKTNKIKINSMFVNEYRTDYEISVYELEQLIRNMFFQLENIPDQYTAEQTTAAYLAATALAVLNLANITKEYTRTVTTVLISEEYQRRVALLSAQVLDDMKLFKARLGTELATVLRQAIQDGLAPSEVTALIKDKFESAKKRAELAVTNAITNAVRNARLDESQYAEEKLGLRVRMLWISALRPTTRPWHAIRHGRAYTIQEVRAFYAVNGNRFNCKCTMTECLVDAKGIPTATKTVDRLKMQRLKYFAS